jgi:hypothetical protein
VNSYFVSYISYDQTFTEVRNSKVRYRLEIKHFHRTTLRIHDFKTFSLHLIIYKKTPLFSAAFFNYRSQLQTTLLRDKPGYVIVVKNQIPSSIRTKIMSVSKPYPTLVLLVLPLLLFQVFDLELVR